MRKRLACGQLLLLVQLLRLCRSLHRLFRHHRRPLPRELQVESFTAQGARLRRSEALEWAVEKRLLRV